MTFLNLGCRLAAAFVFCMHYMLQSRFNWIECNKSPVLCKCFYCNNNVFIYGWICWVLSSSYTKWPIENDCNGYLKVKLTIVVVHTMPTNWLYPAEIVLQCCRKCNQAPLHLQHPVLHLSTLYEPVQCSDQ